VKWYRWASHNWALKLTALGLALLLWAMLRADAPTRVAVPEVPVQVEVHDPGWVAQGAPVPARVTVTFLGPARELVRLAVERPQVVIPVEVVRDSVMVLQVQPRWVRLRDGLDRSRIEDVQPGTVRVSFESIVTRNVPVAPAFVGVLPDQLELRGEVQADPATVRLTGPASQVLAIDSVRLEPVDLSRTRGPAVLHVRVGVDTVGLRGVLLSPPTVQLRLPIVTRDTLLAPARDVLGHQLPPADETPAEPEPEP
jgi:YbbR domain-containing protein